MTRPKKLPSPKTRYVTRQQLVAETTALAQAFALTLNQMEDRLRAELGPPRMEATTLGDWPQPGSAVIVRPASHEGNHLAPTGAEGGE